GGVRAPEARDAPPRGVALVARLVQRQGANRFEESRFFGGIDEIGPVFESCGQAGRGPFEQIRLHVEATRPLRLGQRELPPWWARLPGVFLLFVALPRSLLLF